MSDKQMAKAIIDRLPEEKMLYVLTYLQGLSDGLSDSEEDIPNEETVEALEETENAIKSGNVTPFTGSTEDYFNSILEG